MSNSSSSSESLQFDCILISVGNTRTAIALGEGRNVTSASRVDNAHPEAVVDQITSWLQASDGSWQTMSQEQGGGDPDEPVGPLVVIASVNEPVCKDLIGRIRKSHPDAKIRRVGQDLDIPIGTCLREDAAPGDDRLLNAVAAYDILKQACIIVDAGTAVTVDFVDGEGTFHGGAIAPGAQMQLNALKGGTSALPQIDLTKPDDEPFAGNTKQAMLQGVYFGVRGMVRHLAERYAEGYGAYPLIVATGGDAHLLFDDDELIDRIVDDLTLRGILATARFDWAQAADESGAFVESRRTGHGNAGIASLPDSAMVTDARVIHVQDDHEGECDCGHDHHQHDHDHRRSHDNDDDASPARHRF